jgi:DNA helicase HerA-like ATPase
MGSAMLIRRQVLWPQTLPAHTAEELIRRLAAEDIPVTFEAHAVRGVVSHYVAAPAHAIRHIVSTIEALTGARTIKTSAEQAPDLSTTARLTRSRSSLPLLERAPDVSRQLLAALSSASFKHDALLLRVSILGGIAPQILSGRAQDPTQSLPSRVVSGPRPASGEINAKLRRALEEPAVRLLVTAGASAKSEKRRRSLLGGVLAAFRTLQGPGTVLDFVRSDDNPERPRLLGRLTFTVREALSGLAWPLDDEVLPGMPAAHPRQLPLLARKTDTSRIFAVTTAPGPEREIGISIKSGTSHTHILGPTGSGKSSTIEHLIKSSIAAGHSILVIDPKTDLAERTLSFVPEERWDDVVVIDPAAEGLVVGLNPLHSPGTAPEIIADTILQIIQDLFEDFGPRTSQATLSALLTLAGNPDATLTMLPRLFEDRRLRELLMANNSSEDLREFWNYYDGLSEGARSQMIGPVRSRLGQFLLRPQLRRTLEQAEPRFHLNDLFASPGRIVVANLNAGLMGQAASNLAGSLIVSLVQQLTLARLRVPPDLRHPVMIVVDEVQSFVHGSGDQLSDALSRSRGANVGWVLAHQHRSQLPRDIMSSIDANTLSKIVFRLPSDDAKAMAAMTTDLEARDFMSLPQWGIYASLHHEGKPLGWVSGRTLPPPKSVSDPTAVRRHSLARWGAEAVKREPAEPTSTPPIGRRPRSRV